MQGEKSVTWGQHGNTKALLYERKVFFTSDLTAISFDFAPTLYYCQSSLAHSHLSKKVLPTIEVLLQRTVIAPLPLEEYSCTTIRNPSTIESLNVLSHRQYIIDYTAR